MMVPDFDGGGGGVGYGGVDGYGVRAFPSFSSAQVAPPGQEPTIIVTEVEKVNYAENVKKEEENDGHDLMKVLCNKSNTYSAFASGDCGGDGLTWGSSNDEAAAVDFVTIKEEEEGGAVDFVDNDGNMDRSELSSLSSTSTEALPKPMEGLYESGPPPFLKKIYDMVEDPETDPVVSWSANRSSFVVWETQYFSEKLLPKYFKHKNFSSFIRQLNTYGFRKINSDRWEFANEKFQRGKKHLLKAIKRRNRSNKPQGGAIACVSLRNHDLENEIEALKNDQNTLRYEILELNRKQEDSHNQMTSFEERIRCGERKQQQMLNFVVKIAKYPNFVQKLIQKRKKRQREINGIDELDKRPRLLSHQQQHFASMQSELPDMLLYRMDSDDDAVQEQFDAMCGNGNMISHGDGLNPEKNVGECKELCVNDAQIFQDLEDLIGEPGGWAMGQLAD